MTDSDVGDTATVSLVCGEGSADNGSFTVVGNELRTAASFDYDTKSSYSIRLRATDAVGLYYEKTFTISVTNVNEAMSSLSLSHSLIAENASANTTVGTLSSNDPDAGDTDNGLFN